jgi:hypothetical protein
MKNDKDIFSITTTLNKDLVQVGSDSGRDIWGSRNNDYGIESSDKLTFSSFKK